MLKFDIEKIIELMPHRYPFLLLDSVEQKEDNLVIGIKNVTYNEPFFQGHFPGDPIMPGVLIIESLVQTGGFLLFRKLDNPKEKSIYFTSINKAKFRHPVRPGDVLRHEVELVSFRSNFCKIKGRSFVGDKIVAEGEFTAAITKRKRS